MILSIIIAVIVIALIVAGLPYLSPPFDAGIVRIMQGAAILLGALWIAHIAGLV